MDSIYAMEQQRSFFKRFFASRTFLVAGILVLMFLSLAYARAYYQNYKIHEEIRQMLDEASRVEAKNAELKSLLSRVKQQDYVEEKARTELNLVKAGENVTVIVGANAQASSRQGQGAVVESKQPSNPRLWWNYFFNHN